MSSKNTANTVDAGMVDRVFKEFIEPNIEILRAKFPLVKTYAVTVYLRTSQYATVPHLVIATTPFCEIGRENYVLLWEEVVKEAPKRGYQVKMFPPGKDHPYVVCLQKTFED